MLRRVLALVTILGLAAGCTTASDSTTTTVSSEPTTSATVPSTTVPTDDSAPATETTRRERTDTTRVPFELDMPVEVDGIEYLVPSAICSADAEELRSVLNQLMASTQRSVEALAGGWPTTTMAPDPETARQELDQLAIAATAMAIHENRLGILEQRWADLNAEYSQFDGASSGPIDDATRQRWATIGGSVAEAIDSACETL